MMEGPLIITESKDMLKLFVFYFLPYLMHASICITSLTKIHDRYYQLYYLDLYENLKLLFADRNVLAHQDT